MHRPREKPLFLALKPCQSVVAVMELVVLKYLAAAAIFAAFFATPADAQQGGTAPVPESMANVMNQMNGPADPTRQPVETLTCDQMYAEMFTAGQQMNAQLDPSFAANAQAMQNDVERQRAAARNSMAAGIGMGMACSIPGVGMACAAAQQAQAMNQGRQARENQERMFALGDQVAQSTQGIDMQRMQAISDRWSAQSCEAPQGPPPQ